MEMLKQKRPSQSVYMELTHRLHGGEGWDLGTVLWSPAYGKKKDTWRIMRDVNANDIIIHSLKGEHGKPRTIDGISLVQRPYYVTEIAPPIISKAWESDKYYKIPLLNYQPINKKLYVTDFLQEYDSQLKALGPTHSFYERGRYRCAQKYLAKIPQEVLDLLIEYFDKHDISFLPSNIDEESLTINNNHQPERISIVTSRIIRDSKIVQELKQQYENKCQICGQRIKLPNGSFYSEGHHLQKLGGVHQGPDIKENIIILCPYYHAEFDYGSIAIQGHKIVHIDTTNPWYNKTMAYVRSDLGQEYIQYHMDVIYDNGK